MVGAELVREAIKDPDVTEIYVVVRRPIEITDPKLRVIFHSDFHNYSSLDEVFKKTDVCAWCLGISQTQVNKEKYIEITYDYVVAAARDILNANPSITFMFVSGGGADPTEKSRTLFARIKGKAENTLLKFPFKKLYLLRPAAIMPIHRNKNMPFAYRLFLPLFPILRLLTPNYVITSVELAKVMLALAKNIKEKIVYENAELKAIFKGL